MAVSGAFYRRAANAVSRLLADEIVVVRVPDGEMMVLNQSASVLWAIMDGRRTSEDMAQFLAERYGLAALPEVTLFLDELIACRIAEKGEPLATPLPTLPLPPTSEYAPPAIKAREAIETLAGICNSSYGGIYAACQTFPACPDPWG